MNRYARLCAGVIRAFLVRPNAADREPANRREMVGAVERTLALRARRRARRIQLARGSVIAAAAAIVVVAGWMVSRRNAGVSSTTASNTSNPRSRAHVERTLTVLGSANSAADLPLDGSGVAIGGAANRRPLARGMTLEPGTGLVAPSASEVRIGTPQGTVLTLERGGELTVVEQSAVQRFSLRQGAVRAQVVKLQPTERFIIATDDAEVEVHGTVFRVATVAPDPACGNGVRTRISVFEGVVGIRTGGVETLVPAGAEWPEACPRPAPISAGPVTMHAANLGNLHQSRRGRGPQPAASPADASTVVRETSASAGPSSTAAPSVLAVQNDLFAAAIRARRQKRIAESVRLFSQLVDTYPEGPLTEGAMAQRMRLLATVDREASARVASEYLRRFPAGFACVEARRLVGPTP